MDDMDKEAIELGGKARFFTKGFEKYAWTKLLDQKLGGHERLELYGEAVAKMSQNPHIPQLFRDIFKDAFLPYRSPETLTLFLKIETFTGLPNLLNIPSTGLPLKVELITEYVLDPDSGRIVQQRLVESRLNDQLTPGDFLSRVLLRGQDGFLIDENAWRRLLADVIGRLTYNRSK